MCPISKKAMKVYQDLELWSSVDDGTTYTTSKAYMIHVFSIERHCDSPLLYKKTCLAETFSIYW